MRERSESRPQHDVPVHLWASVGGASSPPERIQAEVCVSCSALVPVATFDRHGQFHAALDRLVATATE